MDLTSCLQSIGSCLFDERGQVALSLLGGFIATVIAGAWIYFKSKSEGESSPSQLTSENQSTNQVAGGDQSANQVNNINASGDSNVSVKQQVK